MTKCSQPVNHMCPIGVGTYEFFSYEDEITFAGELQSCFFAYCKVGFIII